MHTMLAAVIISTFLAPPSFKELEIEKVKAYRAAKTFYEEVELTYKVGTAAPTTTTRKTWRNGDQWRVELAMPNTRFELISDGKKSWMIQHTAKNVLEQAVPPEAGRPEDDVLTTEEGEFQISPQFKLPIQVGCNPAPTVAEPETVSEKDKKYRKFSSVSKREAREIKIVQWFLPEQYLLRKIEVEGQSLSGKMSIVAVWKSLDFSPKFGPDFFNLDPKLIEGYAKETVDGQRR